MAERSARPLAWLLLLSAACAGLPAARGPRASAELHVTSGALEHGADGALLIREGSVRAELTRKTDAAELQFVYRGPARGAQPLASGELRRQIGLKLRARDTCNVVYVMWHIEPRAQLEVSVKSNPAQRTHAECRDHGYHFVRGRSVQGVPLITPDVWHRLRAELHGRELRVWADGRVAWEGTLPDTALHFDGPVGLRSDNGRFELHFEAP